MKRRILIVVVVLSLLSSCTTSTATPVAVDKSTATVIPSPTQTEVPTSTSTPTLIPTSTPTLSPDQMVYNFASNVSMEDQALVKEGVRIARHYLLNNFGSDIKGSYVINVSNNPNDTSNSGRVNGNVMTLNVGHEFWTGSNVSWQLKLVIHETSHFWQHEQGGGPGCGFLYDATGYSASHDPKVDVLDEGHAEYVGFMAAGLEEEAFALTKDNLAIFLSPVNRNLENSYPIRRIGIYWLIKQKGALAFTRFCNAITENKPFADAFEDGFEMTFEEFTKGLKQYLFGGLSALCLQNGCDKEKLMAVWQAQEGCFVFLADKVNPPIDFLVLGYPQYIAAIASNGESELTPDLALDMWQTSEWNEKKWFIWDIVKTLAFKNLFDLKGAQPFAEYCADVQQGIHHDVAFKSAFGMTVSEYRSQFKTAILGDLATCTVATCGAGVDVYSGKYKLGHLLDPTKTTPNLIVRFVDENNEPVVLTHVEMHKQTVGTTGEYAQPFVVPGIFSQAMLPGRYGFTFCEPGYPTDHSSLTCKSPQETEWFDVFEDQVTEVTFQLQQPTTNTNLSSPNLIVTFLDKNGNQIPDLGVEICSYGSPVRICDSGGLTDLNGVYRGYLRSGTYLIRAHIIGAEWPTEMYDIVVNETGVTEVSFKFAKPNLVVKFTDANGTGVPEHELTLCKMVNGVGDCYASSHLGAALGRMGITNMEGIFEALVEPGEYYILTCKIACHLNPPDYKIEDIIVTSETEVTTVEFQLYK